MRYRTSQHINVLNEISETGRYVLSPQFVCNEMNGDAELKSLVMEAYDWLAQNMPTRGIKPGDASYPIWLSLNTDSGFPPVEDGVVMELEIPDEYVALISVEKWGRVLDYRYIPADDADDRRHRRVLEDYGVSDAKAFMSNFYPDIKREIMDSWKRLFDVEGVLPEMCYGLVWELREEWLVR